MKLSVRGRAVLLVTVLMVLLVQVPVAMASPTGEVECSVQTLEYSITIDSGEGLSFGSADFSSSVTPEYGQVVVVTNNGTMDATLLCMGEDAQNEDGKVWTLQDVPGPCEYAFSLTNIEAPDQTVQLSTEPRLLWDSIGAGEALVFSPKLDMPIASMTVGDFSWRAYICATAPVEL